MCPNCINQGTWVWFIPGLICVAFLALGIWFYLKGKSAGEFTGDEEEAKYAVFDD